MPVNIETLRAVLPQLDARSREFAESLLRTAARYGNLTPRQEPWVQRLIERAGRPPQVHQGSAPAEAPAQAISIGNMDAVFAMFAEAGRHLRNAAIVLRCDTTDVRLALATTGSYQGNITVVDENQRGWRNRRRYYGRVTPGGSYLPHPRNEQPGPLVGLLRQFAAAPAAVAGAHGRLTGRCCFCRHRLTDERSTAVGYGPDCAEHFGLPWGSRPARQDSIYDRPPARPFAPTLDELRAHQLPPPALVPVDPATLTAAAEAGDWQRHFAQAHSRSGEE